jgi:hypothetical protein
MRRTLFALTVAASLLTPGASPFLLDRLLHLLSTISGATVTSDEGCGFDPDGRCLPKPKTDAGCGIDPYGICLSKPQTDAGCGMDPDGCPKGS